MSRTYRLRHFRIGPPRKWVDAQVQCQYHQSMSEVYGLIAHGILGFPCLIVGQNNVSPDESDAQYWPANSWAVWTKPIVTSHQTCLEQLFVEPTKDNGGKGQKTPTRKQIEELIKGYLPKNPVSVECVATNPWVWAGRGRKSSFFKQKRSKKHRRDDHVQIQEALIRGTFETLGSRPNYRKPDGFWW
jgi:hypothetical protein